MHWIETDAEKIMNDVPRKDDSDDELERRVAALESEEWLGALKGLKPAVGVDLYAIGFAAGKLAVLSSNKTAEPSVSSVWLHARTALCSSAVSIAATLLLLVTLPEGASRQAIAPIQSDVTAQLETSAVVIENVAENTPENMPENTVQSTMPVGTDVLAGMPVSWRARLQNVERKVADENDLQFVADVDSSRLRYAFQRRKLMESLRGAVQ